MYHLAALRYLAGGIVLNLIFFLVRKFLRRAILWIIFVLVFDILYVQSANRYTSSRYDQMYALAMYGLGNADVFAISRVFIILRLRVQQQTFWRSRILHTLVKFLSVIICPHHLVTEVNQCVYHRHFWKIKFYFMYTYTV
jgi:hypothetical protein